MLDDDRHDDGADELPGEWRSSRPGEGRPAGPDDEQRALLRRILIAFVAVVVLLPFAALGGAWSLLLVPLLVAGAIALHAAVGLHRSR